MHFTYEPFLGWGGMLWFEMGMSSGSLMCSEVENMEGGCIKEVLLGGKEGKACSWVDHWDLFFSLFLFP